MLNVKSICNKHEFIDACYEYLDGVSDLSFQFLFDDDKEKLVAVKLSISLPVINDSNAVTGVKTYDYLMSFDRNRIVHRTISTKGAMQLCLLDYVLCYGRLGKHMIPLLKRYYKAVNFGKSVFFDPEFIMDFYKNPYSCAEEMASTIRVYNHPYKEVVLTESEQDNEFHRTQVLVLTNKVW